MIVTVIVLSLADYHRVVLNQAVTFNSSWALNSPADPVANEAAPEQTGETPQPQAQQAVGPRSWPSQLWIEFFTHVRISSSVYTMLSYITSFSGVPSSESRRLAREAARGRDKPPDSWTTYARGNATNIRCGVFRNRLGRHLQCLNCRSRALSAI